MAKVVPFKHIHRPCGTPLSSSDGAPTEVPTSLLTCVPLKSVLFEVVLYPKSSHKVVQTRFQRSQLIVSIAPRVWQV
eukprot:m.33513 g.33513  ORF g.33513 m.33513 type:complete len:77 (+) comp12238_c0_seq8:1543-1773(+)